MQYSPERLARFGGRSFHLENLRHNVDVYLVRRGFVLNPHFPYVYISGEAPPRFPEARIDMVEPTLGVPYAMPALFTVGVFAAGLAAWQLPRTRLSLAVTWIAAAPMFAGMFTIIVLSHRYTADFCPPLIASAAYGLAMIDCCVGPLRRASLGVVAALLIVSIMVTAALALHFRGEVVWGVPPETKQQYQKLRRRVDGFFGLPP